jgi:hypothetical protein
MTDYPLQRRKPTWKDSLYFRITMDTLAACAIVILVVPPVLAVFQLVVELPQTLRLSLWEVLKTTLQLVLLWGLPYVWMSFFVIEKTRMRYSVGD